MSGLERGCRSSNRVRISIPFNWTERSIGLQGASVICCPKRMAVYVPADVKEGGAEVVQNAVAARLSSPRFLHWMMDARR